MALLLVSKPKGKLNITKIDISTFSRFPQVSVEDGRVSAENDSTAAGRVVPVDIIVLLPLVKNLSLVINIVLGVRVLDFVYLFLGILE